jgi:hypothetical protein
VKTKVRQHSTKKSPAQLQREIDEALSQEPSITTGQIERYRSGRKWGWTADLAFKAATGRPLNRTPGRRSHATKKSAGRGAREESIRKLVRRAIRGLGAKDGVWIQERVERIVHEANKSGPRIGIQGDLARGDDGIELWFLEGDWIAPILSIERESGSVVFR